MKTRYKKGIWRWLSCDQCPNFIQEVHVFQQHQQEDFQKLAQLRFWSSTISAVSYHAFELIAAEKKEYVLTQPEPRWYSSLLSPKVWLWVHGELTLNQFWDLIWMCCINVSIALLKGDSFICFQSKGQYLKKNPYTLLLTIHFTWLCCKKVFQL